MAITIVSSPNTLTSLAYRPIIYTWTSDAVDLQYCIVEVLINDIRVSARSVQMDSGSTTAFTLDISSECQKHLSFQLKPINSSGVLTNDTGESIQNIKIYEVTVDSGGLIVTDYSASDDNNSSFQYQSVNNLITNWLESHFDYANFNLLDYRLSSNTSLFMTSSPYAKSIELDSDEFIGLFYHLGAASKNFKLEVLTYNSAGNLLNTDNINITEWNTPIGVTPVDSYLSIAVGTKNLINEGISLTTVSHYTIQVINDDGDQSEIKRYNIVQACSSDTRIHWANKFGKQSSYTFKGNKLESLTHNSSTYKQALGLTYSSEGRGDSVIQATSTTNFTTYTDSVSRDTYRFISEILVNKIAWLQVGNDYFPITIDNGTKLVLNERDMPMQFNLNFSFANSTKGLRG